MGKSQKFEELAEQVMPLLGGRDNITWFSHCVTRLRFTVKDHGLVDKDGIDLAAIDAQRCGTHGGRFAVFIGVGNFDRVAAAGSGAQDRGEILCVDRGCSLRRLLSGWLRG